MFTLPLGENARLGPLEPSQAPEFFEHIERARPNVDPFIPWAGFSPDLDSARSVLQRYADRQATDTGRIYGIRLDGRLVGGVMFVKFDVANGTAELGCWLETDGQGLGLVHRACRLLIDWAFEERGMSRLEWWADAGNARSVAAARRLGFTRDGVMRSHSPYRGVRRDCEVWSLLKDDSRETGAEALNSRPTAADSSAEEELRRTKAELDSLMGQFLGAFTNTGGRTADLSEVPGLFVPGAVITDINGTEPAVRSVEAFLAPRRTLLADGTLTEFCEWETFETTEIRGRLAQRFSAYAKSGVRGGRRFEGVGHKTTHFVRTAHGWRIAALTWADEES